MLILSLVQVILLEIGDNDFSGNHEPPAGWADKFKAFLQQVVLPTLQGLPNVLDRWSISCLVHVSQCVKRIFVYAGYLHKP